MSSRSAVASGVRSVVAFLIMVLGGLPAHAGTVAIGTIALPAPKAGGWELKHAFGKTVEADCRAEVGQDLQATGAFDAIVDQGGDWTFALEIESAKRTFEDLVALSGRGTLQFTLQGSWTWTPGSGAPSGTSAKSGTFDVVHVVNLERMPWRSDLEAGWREVIRQAVAQAGGAMVSESGQGG